MGRQVSRGTIDQAKMDAGLALIRPALDLGVVGQTDLTIEAATEDEELKKQIFRNLQPHLKPDQESPLGGGVPRDRVERPPDHLLAGPEGRGRHGRMVRPRLGPPGWATAVAKKSGFPGTTSSGAFT